MLIGTRIPVPCPSGCSTPSTRSCDRFERALASGGRPRIEDYLADVTTSGQAALFHQLLGAELDWRRGRGERPAPAEYLSRFPDRGPLVEAAFAGVGTGDAGETAVHLPLRGVGEADTSTSSGPAPEGVQGGRDDRRLRPGDEPIPGHRLIEYLGGGGFGQVWKAEAPGGVLVALKFVRLAGGHGEAERRAFETIKGIRHPNLLALFGAWVREGVLIIGSELGDCTLLDRLDRCRGEGHEGIPWAELIEYLAEAAKGLDFLNGRVHAPDGRERPGVQHRDIKPQNILLVGGGVKVADFGLARLLRQSDTGHTGAMTPAYAAPEFFNGRTSDRSDQYSLAVTYCHLRGGRRPYEGDVVAMMAGHVLRPPDLTMLPEVERPVVTRALAKDPSERWATCHDFVAALRACHESPRPRPPDEPGSRPQAPPARGAVRGAPAGRVGWPRTRRMVVLAGLLVAVVLTGRAIRGPGPGGTREANPDRASLGVPMSTRAGLAGARGSASPGVDRATPGEQERNSDALSIDQRPPASGGRQPVESSGVPPGAVTPDSLPAVTRPVPPPEQSVQKLPPRAVTSGATDHLERGGRLFDERKFEDAVVEYSEAIAADPDNAVAYNNRGNAYRELGYFKNAVEDLEPGHPAGADCLGGPLQPRQLLLRPGAIRGGRPRLFDGDHAQPGRRRRVREQGGGLREARRPGQGRRRPRASRPAEAGAPPGAAPD